MVHPSYAGCWWTEPFANIFGLTVDQFNFIGIQFVGILFGLFFHLSLQHTSTTLRHLYCLVLGVFSLWFCNGWETWHMALMIGVCYLMMNTLPPQIMHICVLLFSLAYLVAICFYRYLLPEEMQFLDITFPCTMTVQKVSSLAFSISDYSRYKLDENSIKDSQKKRLIKKPPDLLQFLSYMFYFQGILAGPFSFYNDYIDFIEGHHIETRMNCQENEKGQEVRIKVDPKTVTPLRVVFYKFVMLLFWIFVFLYVSPVFVPTSYNADADFIKNHGVLARIAYLYVSMLCHRSKYYLTWTLSDIVYNASGYGFNGIDKDGNSKWDMLTNVRPEKIETSTSFKAYIDSWNIMTTHWLRYVCYDRAPHYRTHLTYLLSAVWHGVYPGFYCTFLSAIWFTLAGRKIRKYVRPLFQETAASRGAYEVITWFGTQVPIAYIVLPFIFCDVAPFITFYNSVYWCFHVIVALILLIPVPAKPKHRHDNQDKQEVSQSASANMSNGNSNSSHLKSA